MQYKLFEELKNIGLEKFELPFGINNMENTLKGIDLVEDLCKELESVKTSEEEGKGDFSELFAKDLKYQKVIFPIRRLENEDEAKKIKEKFKDKLKLEFKSDQKGSYFVLVERIPQFVKSIVTETISYIMFIADPYSKNPNDFYYSNFSNALIKYFPDYTRFNETNGFNGNNDKDVKEKIDAGDFTFKEKVAKNQI